MATLEMKTVLRAVLSRATVLPANRRMERPSWRSVIVTPHAGSRVVLSPRGRDSASFGPGRLRSTPTPMVDVQQRREPRTPTVATMGTE
jgi:hypothetical protein